MLGAAPVSRGVSATLAAFLVARYLTLGLAAREPWLVRADNPHAGDTSAAGPCWDRQFEEDCLHVANWIPYETSLLRGWTFTGPRPGMVTHQSRVRVFV